MLSLRLFFRLNQLHMVSLGSCACLLAALLLSACSPGNTVNSHSTSTVTTSSTTAEVVTPTATIASTVIAPVTPTITKSLTPLTTPLAPPPQNCALRSPPQEKHLENLGMNNNVSLLGGGPFWIYGLFYPGVLHLAQSGNKQWPMTKLVVEVGPNYNQPVTLRLRELRTGTLAWWTDGQMPPGAATQTLVLDPETDTGDVGAVPGVPDIPHGSPDPGWSEWGIFPLFLVAGCYTLEVSWSGGSWQSSFAAGS